MASHIGILFFLVHSLQAVLCDEHHFHILEELQHDLEEQISSLEILEKDTRETLKRFYVLEEANVLAKHRANSEAVLRLANQKNCDVPTLHQLDHQATSWKGRFESCVNLTQMLVYYEGALVKIYQEYLQLKPMVCEGANNIALCLKEKSGVIERLTCSYDTVEGTTNKIGTLKKDIVTLVNYVQGLIADTANDVMGCFGFHTNSFLETQKRTIEQSC